MLLLLYQCVKVLHFGFEYYSIDRLQLNPPLDSLFHFLFVAFLAQLLPFDILQDLISHDQEYLPLVVFSLQFAPFTPHCRLRLQFVLRS